ncbi:putative ATPase [Bradyrhizobium diazoefficiens]
MINELTIKGFKRFTEHAFAFRSLTVLAGMNGAGKSSVIHALLLTCEAVRKQNSIVELNGPFNLELGVFEDVLNRETLGNFSFELVGDDLKSTFEFSQERSGLQKPYAYLRSGGPKPAVFGAGNRSFQYLSAERFGPRVTLLHQSVPQDFLEIGVQGEYSAQLLDALSALQIEERRCCEPPTPEIPALLKAQAELWLSQLTRPVQIDTETFVGTLVAAIKYRVEDIWLKPTNMGFGVTYALPVVLAGLSTTKGGLLIVENPEAHLHPAGQTQMGIFLASMAGAGVQVLLETHSDHVLNGIRRAIAERKILPADSAIVHFFGVGSSPPEALYFNEAGSVSHWPQGFFDQYQIDIAALSRVRRSR